MLLLCCLPAFCCFQCISELSNRSIECCGQFLGRGLHDARKHSEQNRTCRELRNLFGFSRREKLAVQYTSLDNKLVVLDCKVKQFLCRGNRVVIAKGYAGRTDERLFCNFKGSSFCGKRNKCVLADLVFGADFLQLLAQVGNLCNSKTLILGENYRFGFLQTFRQLANLCSFFRFGNQIDPPFPETVDVFR